MPIVTGEQILASDVINALGVSIFGDGSDGDVTIAGATSLVRDMFYNDLTVNAAQVLNTAGYRIFVKGTLTNNGTIRRTAAKAGYGNEPGTMAAASLGGGGSGGNGREQIGEESAGAGGSGGGIVFISAKIIDNNGTISANGGEGGDAVASGVDNVNPPTAGASVTNSLGGAGGNGGVPPAGAGTGGTATAPAASEGGFRAIHSAILLRIASAHTQIVGGGGGGGGQVITLAGGGGGGGGGGFLIIIYQQSLGWTTETAVAGAGGAGIGGGAAGSAGSAGTVIKIGP